MFLKARSKADGFDRLVAIAVTRDADGNAKAAFRSVQGALKEAQLPAPGRMGDIAQGPPRVHVLVLPNNEQRGMLETLCKESLVHAGAARCVDDFLSCMNDHGKLANNRDKAWVYSWLAAVKPPTERVGLAAKQGLWDFSSAAFKPLIELLEVLRK